MVFECLQNVFILCTRNNGFQVKLPASNLGNGVFIIKNQRFLTNSKLEFDPLLREIHLRAL